ncbi:MAG TPA: DUF2800 domain-containing protein [Blastocatellia bacterium]|nr:DUF2800 domain-containing protein [Blastocatellia bacterium]
MPSLPILSASYLPRVMACPASHVLPQFKQEVSAAAARGTNIHAFLEVAFNQGRETALEQFAPDLPGIDVARALDLELLWADLRDGLAEATFAFDPVTQTARLLGTSLGRQYENTGEILGTADFVARHADTRQLVIVDYKTGLIPVDAATSYQLAFLALAAQLHYDTEEVIARIVQIREDATFHFNERVYSAELLREFAGHLHELQQVISVFAKWHEMGKTLPVTIGEHCKYCPALASCPASASVFQNLQWATDKDSLAAWDVARLNAQEAGALWDRLQLIKKALDVQDAALRDYARENVLETAGGKQLMLGQQLYSQIALAPALEIIANVCGQDLADHLLGATNAKLPKTELEAALKASGLQGGELRQVLAVLNHEFEKQGALIYGTREVIQPAEKVRLKLTTE